MGCSLTFQPEGLVRSQARYRKTQTNKGNEITLPVETFLAKGNMRRNIHVMYKNFRGIVLTKTLFGFEGRLNPAQLKKELEDKNVECSLVVGWSVYEPDEATELTPSQAMDFHDCLQELSDVDIRFNVNGHSIENGSIRLSYNIYEHNIMVTRVWLNGKESKELLDTIQQWLDNNQE